MDKKYLKAVIVCMLLLILIRGIVASEFQINEESSQNTLPAKYTPEIYNSKHIISTEYNCVDSKKATIKGYADPSKKIKVDNFEFKLQQATNIGNGIRVFSYEQNFNSVPVYSSSLNFITKNNNVVATKRDYFTDIALDTVNELTDYQINKIICEYLDIKHASHFKSNLDCGKVNIIKKDKKLIILPLGSEDNIDYKLAWKIDLPTSKEPPASWTLFIDAKTGKIIEKTNKIKSATVNGSVAGNIYHEHPGQTAQNKYFSNEFVHIGLFNSAFWSSRGDNIDTYMITKDYINLTEVSEAALIFSIMYDIEPNYDFAYVWIWDGADWSLLNSYTGHQSSWLTENIDMSRFAGKMIKLAFEYVTDSIISYDGFIVDNIKVSAHENIKFYDDAENGSDKWDLSNGFVLIGMFPITNSTTTDEEGFYSLSKKNDDSWISSQLLGNFVSVHSTGSENGVVTHYNNTIGPVEQSIMHNWNWADDDNSYKKEQSNVFYHINKIHDFFTRGAPFDINSMNYQMKATVEYPGSCNAFATGEDIYFYAPSEDCEALSLYSDVIYHEYTHNVVDKIYSPIYLPYIGQSGAMNEGWADYFASTINNNSCMTEDWAGYSCLRDLNNTNKYPDDIVGEVHEDSLIFSGALWDLRSASGANVTDSLVIKTMKLKADDFFEYLDDVLLVDNEGNVPTNGTPNWHQICASFSEHGITSDFCSPIILSYEPSIRPNETQMIVWENPLSSLHTNIHYCTPSFGNCNYNHYENVTLVQSGQDGNYFVSLTFNIEGDWQVFVHTSDYNRGYYSEIKNISVIACASNWVLEENWTKCDINDMQYKDWRDINNCRTPTDKPAKINQTCDYCTPNLMQINETCEKSNTFLSWYNDTNSCYATTNLDSDKVPVNQTFLCDYCKPSWQEIRTVCQPDDSIKGWYNDTNDCYAQTNLISDLDGKPESKAYEFSCDYNKDGFIGDAGNINTTLNINLTVSGNIIEFKENRGTLLKFNYNLTNSSINLASITIERQSGGDSFGYLLVKGLDLTAQGGTKTVTFDRILGGTGVCVKDAELNIINDISAACNGAGEIWLACPGIRGEYSCKLVNSNSAYGVSGMKHSGVREQATYCGDRVCNGAEACSSCSTDCGACPQVSPQSGGVVSGGGGWGRSHKEPKTAESRISIEAEEEAPPSASAEVHIGEIPFVETNKITGYAAAQPSQTSSRKLEKTAIAVDVVLLALLLILLLAKGTGFAGLLGAHFAFMKPLLRKIFFIKPKASIELAEL